MGTRRYKTSGFSWQTRLNRAILALIWGIGYFFGFSLVAILTLGLFRAEEFPVLVHGRKQRHRFVIFKEHGNFYLEAQIVAVLGWIFVSLLSFFAIG